MSIYRGKNQREFYLASLLYDSIEDKDLSSVKSLLSEKGADPNLILPKKGIAPFHLAVGIDPRDFSITVTTLILQHGGNPNVRSDEGLTPVHISAAWNCLENLQLLLSNGGDPEAKDSNRCTPSYYAHKENHVECLNLLKSYTPNKNEIINRESENSKNFNLTFDKILVDNGGCQYEVVQDNTPIVVPSANTTEYVLNWFNKHHPSIDEISICSDPKMNQFSLNTIDSYESSLDESDVPTKEIKSGTITFRKVYRKTRKTPKKSVFTSTVNKEVEDSTMFSIVNDIETIKQHSTESGVNTMPNSPVDLHISDQIQNESMYTAEDFSTMQQYSKESGIITLPNSMLVTGNIPKTTSSAEFSISEMYSPPKMKTSLIKIDASSDYNTCSTASEKSSLVNSFEMTDDLSIEFTQDETKGDLISLTHSKSSSPELSFVTVSELYKYVDEDEGIILFERRFLKTPTGSCGSERSSAISSNISSLPETIDYDTDTLRKELTSHGYNPGPITFTTKRIYLKKLKQLRTKAISSTNVQDISNIKKVYSIEIEKTFRDPTWVNDLAVYKSLEEAVSKQFSTPDPTRKWREGVNKASFTYLLLDPRVTNNLPCRAEQLQPKELWETFIKAIFYVGKGKRSRPYAHLYDAISVWKKNKEDEDAKLRTKKIQHILDIWHNNTGVICLHVFQNVIPVEAYTREASMILALKLDNLDNIKSGEFYGIAATWSLKQKRMLGVYLLYKAMMIFLHEGERQLCPADID